MIFPWFIIFTRNKLILSKNSPSAIPRSPKSHLPWYLRNRFLQNTRRSWWVYCWMHRKLAHWGNTIICSQLCSKVQEESANYSGSFRISETPSYPARNLREISRVQNDIKPVLLCFPPYLAFFFVFFSEITYHFLGQSPSVHIHEEPGLGQKRSPGSRRRGNSGLLSGEQ